MNIKTFLWAISLLLLSSDRAVTNKLYKYNQGSIFSQNIIQNNLLVAQNSDQADQLLKEGTQHYHNNRVQAAIQSWQAALKIYHQQRNVEGEGTTLGRIGLAYERLGNYLQAVDYFEQALTVV